MTRVALKDELLDAQLLRTVGASLYGGSDVGECLSTARRVRGADLDSWHTEWSLAGGRAATLAEQSSDAGQAETARGAYLRASSYFRTAGVMLMGAPLDPRLVEAHARQTDMFRRAAALMVPAAEILEIPFEKTTLPGYFFSPAGGRGARATVVLIGGYDGTAEELYLANGAAALARGYNVLAFDGPGQGAALIQRGLIMRPDWESVITPVLDYALARPDVDPSRVALIGLSLGAHLAPRAASADRRVAACIADCGAYDLYAAFLARLPGPLAGPFAADRPWARKAVAKLLRVLARKPTAGWALRRGLLVHGVDDPLDFVDALRDFTLAGRAADITCPTWVCDADGDDISATARLLVDELTCEKTYVHFKAAEGAGDHCEQGARALYHARSFAWLDDLLHPTCGTDQAARPLATE